MYRYVGTYVIPYRHCARIFAGNECFCTQRTGEGKDFELILTLTSSSAVADNKPARRAASRLTAKF